MTVDEKKIRDYRKEIRRILAPTSTDFRIGLVELQAFSAAIQDEIRSKLQEIIQALQAREEFTAAESQIVAKQLNAILRKNSLAIVDPETGQNASLRADRGMLRLRDRFGLEGHRHETGRIGKLPQLEVSEVSDLRRFDRPGNTGKGK